MYVECIICETKYLFICIYAPNAFSDQKIFIEKLYGCGFQKYKNIIMGGDFNCEMGDCKNKNVWNEWAKFFKNLKLNEIKDNSKVGYT